MAPLAFFESPHLARAVRRRWLGLSGRRTCELCRLKACGAALLNRDLLNRFKLALEPRKLSRLGVVAAHEKGGWPKHNDGGGGGHDITSPLFVLDARQLGCALRYTASLCGELSTIIIARRIMVKRKRRPRFPPASRTQVQRRCRLSLRLPRANTSTDPPPGALCQVVCGSARLPARNRGSVTFSFSR